MQATQQLTVTVALMRAIVVQQRAQILWQMGKEQLQQVTHPQQAALCLLLMVATLKLQVMALLLLARRQARKVPELQRLDVVQLAKVQGQRL